MKKDSTKYGRPPKGSFKRSHKLTIAFNDDELAVMQMKAEAAGLRPAEWCRRCSVQQKIRSALTEEDRKILKGLWNVGNNLNQLVHEMHAKAGFHQSWYAEIAKLMNELKEINAHYRGVMRYDS